MNQITYHNSPRERVRIKFPKKGKTKQSFAHECDINQIMAKYQKTGAVAHINQHGANYGFATGLDFAESMRLITTAQDMFDGLPSSIRTRFANDPAQFLDFVQDANNEEEMQKLGLIPANPEIQASEKPPEAKKEDTPTPAITPDEPEKKTE